MMAYGMPAWARAFGALRRGCRAKTMGYAPEPGLTHPTVFFAGAAAGGSGFGAHFATTLDRALATRVTVIICTAGRPKMLAACLTSVVGQAPPDGAIVDVLVVDNNPRPTVEDIVTTAAAGARFLMRVVHEPLAGIPQARNRGIDEALKGGADWIVFIDDDEVADADWLANLLAAARRFGADVVQGRLTRVYPDRLPPFVLAANHSTRRDGQELTVAYTHNVALAAWLVDPARGGLRFDEALRFTGGSDSRFFRKAHQAGAKIVAADSAVVREVQATERLTLGWQLRREFRIGAGMARTEVALDLPARERKQTPLQMIYRMVRSLVFLVASPLMLFGGVRRFERFVARALNTIASAAGGFAGLYGKLPDPYRKLDGY
jgi:succinoglycan biosynthesis protein ExoM